jgi:hypothetical protein
MSGANVADLVIGVAVVLLLISRQLSVRQLRESYRLVLILAVIGIIEFATYLRGHPHDVTGISAAVVGSLVLAAVMGGLRALTVRVWRGEGGQLLRQGNWLTALLWIVALGVHLGYDYLVASNSTGKNGGDVGTATLLLYLVVSLAVQRFIMINRATRQEAAGQLPTEGPQAQVR